MEAGKIKEIGVAYFIGLEKEDLKYSEEMVISKDMLNTISDVFSKVPITLYTNAGVDLHTKDKGKYKNITVKKVSVKFSKGGDVMDKYKADEYHNIGNDVEYMFDNKHFATKMANDFGVKVEAENDYFFVSLPKDKVYTMKKGGKLKDSELSDHYDWYIDNLDEDEEPISFELWKSEYADDLNFIFKKGGNLPELNSETIKIVRQNRVSVDDMIKFLGRKPRYKENILGITLRKCFLAPFYEKC